MRFLGKQLNKLFHSWLFWLVTGLTNCSLLDLAVQREGFGWQAWMHVAIILFSTMVCVELYVRKHE